MIDTIQDMKDEIYYYKSLYFEQLKFTKHLFFVALVIIGMMSLWVISQHGTISKLEKDNELLKIEVKQFYKKWCDFNSTHIPETALKRI